MAFGLYKDLGIDLGTANTLVYMKGKGIVLSEPSVVALDKETNDVLAVGNDANRMVGRTPSNIIAVRPLKEGVIADLDVTEKMLRHYISAVLKNNRLVKARVLVAVPSGVTEVEKRAVVDAAKQAGAKEARLILEPMAAAIGAGLEVQEAIGNMIVDVGGGTTEVAVISLGGMVTHQSRRTAGDEMDRAIVQYVRRSYSLLIGTPTAEKVKIQIGSAYLEAEDLEETVEVRGRDLVTGLPNTINITAREVQEALRESVISIIDAVRMTLESTPAELSADIMQRGIMLAGGSSLLRGLDKLLARETGMPVRLADDPLCCVAIGAGKALEHWHLLERVVVS
mgnify:FL=1